MDGTAPYHQPGTNLDSVTTDFGTKKLAIPLGSTVIVTGVTGLIGSHIANQLLKAGYKVRGTTRSASKGHWLTELFGKQYGPGYFELTEVSEMDKSEGWVEAIKGISGIAHVASDLSFGPDPNKVVTSTIANVTALMAAASKEPSVKRFVYTSSSTAITAPKRDTKFTIATDQWNEADVKAAWAEPPYTKDRAWAVYGASKTQAEQAAWQFMREKEPSFVLNTVLPNCNFGTILDPQKQSGSTAGWLRGVAQSGKVDGMLLDFPPQWFVDVEDTARIHVAALIDPDVRAQRILAFAQPFNWADIVAILREIYPKRTFEFANEGKEGRDLSELDNSPGAELLKNWFSRDGWAGLKESVARNVKGI